MAIDTGISAETYSPPLQHDRELLIAERIRLRSHLAQISLALAKATEYHSQVVGQTIAAKQQEQTELSNDLQQSLVYCKEQLTAVSQDYYNAIVAIQQNNKDLRAYNVDSYALARELAIHSTGNSPMHRIEFDMQTD